MHVGKNFKADPADRFGVEFDCEAMGIADVGGAQGQPRARVRVGIRVGKPVPKIEPDLPVVAMAHDGVGVGKPPGSQYQWTRVNHWVNFSPVAPASVPASFFL